MTFYKYDRHMRGSPEEKVLAYISTHDHKPLVLSDVYRNSYIFPAIERIEPLAVPAVTNYLGLGRFILLLLDEFRYRETFYLIDGGRQCKRGAYRSVLDMWRTIRYYYIDVDLFSVMRFMSTSSDICRDYCSTVRKRVFCPGTASYAEHVPDEFGLKLWDWRRIGEGD